MSFRPTPVQALGRGAYLGALAGVSMCLAVLVLAASGVGERLGVPVWFAAVASFVIAVVVGALIGLVFGRDEGADVDDVGIHPVPEISGNDAPWQRIEDLRTERHGGRTHIAVCFDTGQVARLRAPYNGRLLAADPEFERKLFMLRNLWETHRSFTLNSGQHPDYGQHPVDGAEPP